MLLLILTGPAAASARPPLRKSVVAKGRYILVDIVDDHVVHLDMGYGAPPPRGPICTSIMVAPDVASSLREARLSGADLTSHDRAALIVEVEAAARCLLARRGKSDSSPIRLCMQAPGHLGNELTLDRGDTCHIYGLGEQFNEPGATDGDCIGKGRGGRVLGNDMVAYSGCMVATPNFS